VFEHPKTKYAQSGDLKIAYQVLGEGDTDLLFVNGWVSNVELIWDEPRLSGFLQRLSGFCRLIHFDKRGTGLSDPVPLDRPPTLEQRMDDALAVLDAVSSERAAVLGFSEGGAMSVLFAATYPQRTPSLMLWGATPRITWAEDWPWGVTRSRGLEQLRAVEAGTPEEFFGLDLFAPSAAGDPEYARWWARFSRLSASPGMYAALMRSNGATDVRDILGTIKVPTLVLHRTGDQVFDVRGARFAAEAIPGARMVEFPGPDHWPWVGDEDAPLAEIERFLTGTTSAPPVHRVLATVLFTDIVDSTAKAEQMGDGRWLQVLDAHDRLVQGELSRRGGTWVKSTGDGVLATFDGPGRAIETAVAIGREARSLDLELRAGIHTGEAETRGDDVAGIAVHLAARVAAAAGAGQVLVTRTVRDLVAGSGIRFADRGVHHFKGVPDEWQVLEVVA